MESLTALLDRKKDINKLQHYLTSYSNDNKAIYIHGKQGVGKTFFIKEALNELNYDAIIYDVSDVRNKNIIDTLNSSISNVYSLLKKEKKKIAIVMDEIDGMNIGDKGGINSLIKMIRPKKSKKENSKTSSELPIICIGNLRVDKKIKDLMKVSNIIEIKVPTNEQMEKIVKHLFKEKDGEDLFYILHYVF